MKAVPLSAHSGAELRKSLMNRGARQKLKRPKAGSEIQDLLHYQWVVRNKTAAVTGCFILALARCVACPAGDQRLL